MQYANTSRKGDPEANAELAGSGHDILAVREDAQVNRGTQILWPYGWSAATWEEIDSGVVGMCAIKGEKGDYLLELATSEGGRGIATYMLGCARVGQAEHTPPPGLHLQVHDRNGAARRRYEGLGGARCAWRDAGTPQRTPEYKGQLPKLQQEMWWLQGKGLDRAIEESIDRNGGMPANIRG